MIRVSGYVITGGLELACWMACGSMARGDNFLIMIAKNAFLWKESV
jgi:hypothetical protein